MILYDYALGDLVGTCSIPALASMNPSHGWVPTTRAHGCRPAGLALVYLRRVHCAATMAALLS